MKMSGKAGIIIISHSFEIGEGIKKLIDQVIEDVPIALACGTENGEIGTSMERIQSAIDQVGNENGAVLLYDLGSAKMNAEMVLELVDRNNLQIAEDVPLVEGSYIAAVEANLGKTVEEIMVSLDKLKIDQSS